jgi:dephospho-CoA kinase
VIRDWRVKGGKGNDMLRVGLTGGIGSGKSTVSARLASLGAVILDADQAARAVVEPGAPGLAAIVSSFGPGVLSPDGSLDRAALASIVFADEAALAKLNAITHPLIHAFIGAAESAAIAAGDPSVVLVHDVALLAEWGRAAEFDVVVVVDVPVAMQFARLTGPRGMTSDQARARMAAQASREQRLAVADIVIDNSGTRADLDRRVDEVWAQLRARSAGNLPTAT